MIDVAMITLLHVLVLVYWLGGDLGAFYASRFVTDPARTAAQRVLAVTIVNAVDLAPRFSMIAALPTGLTLAAAKGWLALPVWALAAAWAGGALWAWAAWTIHVRHGEAGEAARRADEAWRWLFALGLAGWAGAMAWGLAPGPLFLAGKLALLAATVLLGLRVRAQLRDFGPALAALMRDAATPETDQTLRRTLGAARPTVIMIWICLMSAAFLGLWTPA